MTDDGNILLITKQDEWSHHAGEVAKSMLGAEIFWITGRTDEPVPEQIKNMKPRLLISFLSPWIIPETILKRCGRAVNFHPGSTAYPGIGCYNFALYEEAERYGAVCHFMERKVDTGSIIDEITFKVCRHDTVETLKHKTMIMMTSMFIKFLSTYIENGDIAPSNLTWKRRPFTRKELNELCIIKPDMSRHEIQKRILATTYPGYPGAVLKIEGAEFLAPVPQREPLA